MENSKIEWTDHTWNPWYGCKKVSRGCANCYMYREQARYGRDPQTVTRSRTTFRAPLSWAKKARRGGESARVFTCSWSDFFIAEADEWRADAWEIIRSTPELRYLILTKRPERISECLPADWGMEGWDHVWLGVSVEDQEMADLRIPLLLQAPAMHRFLSCEPLLGQVDLISRYGVMPSGIEWVIAGGESGPQARPCDPAWVRVLRDQSWAADVPFFFKQWGEYVPLDAPGMPVEYMAVGRREAGHHLDGVEWRQCPVF